jgi:predicted phosphate transport protein (TIGR00153 family)
MSLLYKNVKELVFDIDTFIDTVEQGVLVFKEGSINYLQGEKTSFKEKIKRINQLEGSADKLQKKIDDLFYTHSILPQQVSDIGSMLDKIDEIIDIAKDNLYQFDDEIPYVPIELSQDFIRLVDASAESALAVLPASRVFFRDPSKVKEMLAKVYFYEKEADKISRNIKRKLFHDMNNLRLSEKMHLRYFALHIETISDKAEALADMLLILALKMNI